MCRCLVELACGFLACPFNAVSTNGASGRHKTGGADREDCHLHGFDPFSLFAGLEFAPGGRTLDYGTGSRPMLVFGHGLG